ncbi:piriformospora indica-insensitive protein 2 [Quercus suber]|uniref:piriformospora indica-insensitive protein 2 n=1 Tax=Quercus suber TaxID=58331 RepID=UPI0032E042B2
MILFSGVSCDLYNGFWYVSALNIGPVYDNSLRCTRYLKSLESLVLLENGLTGELPQEMGSLVNLRRLVLGGNKLFGQIPSSFGGLKELLILDLSMNKLSGSLPWTLGNLTSLLKLDLSNNMLEKELPSTIGSLKNLTLMDLGRNNFSGGLVQSLQGMVSLKEMVMSNNPLLGGNLNGIQWQNLQNLEFLDLSNMGLTGNIPESMTELKRLRFLGLNNNNLSGSPSPRLASLPCISALYLYENDLAGKLEFSEGFYRKMGKRFGAWNNPNICYQAELMLSTSNQFHSLFVIGGDGGWVLPKSRNHEMYNQWASQNRFKVDDTVHFKYKKDSVLVVTAEEYDKCHSARPVFFSNNGATVFKLDKPGLFYFISGVAGHCERGQKMIIKVLEPETAPPLSSKENTTTVSSHKSGAVEMAAISSPISVLFMVSFFGLLFI